MQQIFKHNFKQFCTKENVVSNCNLYVLIISTGPTIPPYIDPASLHGVFSQTRAMDPLQAYPLCIFKPMDIEAHSRPNLQPNGQLAFVMQPPQTTQPNINGSTTHTWPKAPSHPISSRRQAHKHLLFKIKTRGHILLSKILCINYNATDFQTQSITQQSRDNIENSIHQNFL